MEDQLVSFEIAKLAKEKGFDIKTMLMYATTGQVEPYNKIRWSLYHDYYYTPTQSLLQRWLREVHNIHITIKDTIFDEWTFDFHMRDTVVHGWSYATFYNYKLFWHSYEEVLEVALKHALEIIR